MNHSLIRNLLKADGFLIVNRIAIKAFGLDDAIVLAELMRWEDYFSKKEIIEDGGWFYITQDQFEENTTLTARQLRRIIPALQKKGVINVKRRGMPGKHYYQIRYDSLLQSLQKVSTSGYLLSHLTIKEKKKEMRTSKKTFSPYKVELPRNMEYVDIDEDGRELKKKRSGPKPEGKNKIAIRLQRKFVEFAQNILGTSPVMDIKGYKMCLYAMNTGGLTEAQVVDLFDEWFKLGKPDEETISITRALSSRQIEGYKIRNSVK